MRVNDFIIMIIEHSLFLNDNFEEYTRQIIEL